MAMNEEQKKSWDNLVELHKELRSQTMSKYRRINPFYEDLFDWKERGAYWVGEDKGITIYNSTTIAGDVSIGERTWIGPFCSLDGSGGLTIGSYCCVSLGCQLLTHDTARWSLSGGRAPYEYASTKIGDCCFLGTHAVILKGVTVGNHCLIGAGAVVNRDIPDYSIVAGVPARLLGRVHLKEDGEVLFVYGESTE
jgi:acetyltransferase-like isoleucine patch superfamily enzyme